jgi:pimeloyl-ACP methyl ester carboxylesterase
MLYDMIRYVALLIIIGVSCTGCFTRFVMTKREIRQYYKDKPVKPTFFTIQNDSINLFVATAGADTLPPLLVIHGAAGAWYANRTLLEDSTLLKRFHIISADRLGYNQSRFRNKRSAVTSITIQASAIHEALRLNRSFKTGVVLGSSYGAPIAAKMAMLYPNEFHHLVMLAPAIDPDIEKFWWFNPLIRGGLVRWLLPRFINSANDEKLSHVAELKKMVPEWSTLTIPATVVQGGADNIIYPENFEFAKKALQDKQAEFIFLPEAGHLIRVQRPDVVRSILLKQANGANSH